MGRLILLAFPTFPGADATQSTIQLLAIALGIQLITTMASLLIAWAVVRGAHIRSFTGLLMASILIVAFSYARMLLMASW